MNRYPIRGEKKILMKITMLGELNNLILRDVWLKKKEILTCILIDA